MLLQIGLASQYAEIIQETKIYIVFRQDTVTFYTFDIMSNNSLVYLQELKHPLISDFSGLEYLTLPFYS